MHFEPFRAARLAKGLSQAETARHVGHSLSWLYAVERGTLVPNRADATALADLVGGRTADLFGRVRGDDSAT